MVYIINILYEITRFLSFFIIGFILIRWYGNKKEWSYTIKNHLLFIISWKASMLFLLLLLDVTIESYLYSLTIFSQWIYFLFLLLMFLVSFFLNFYIGFSLFKTFYKESKQDGIIIILIIVIVEFILDNLILYSIMISFTLDL